VFNGAIGVDVGPMGLSLALKFCGVVFFLHFDFDWLGATQLR
jgi:hypothetical protein